VQNHLRTRGRPTRPPEITIALPHILVIGATESARRTARGLSSSQHRVTHLTEATDADVTAALTADVQAVAVLVRGDVLALRYALLVNHTRPGIRMVVTVFDRTVAEQLRAVAGNCLVTSPAAVAAPSIIGAILGEGILAVENIDGHEHEIVDVGDATVLRPLHVHRSRPKALLRQLGRQLRPHDGTTRLLLLGLYGLVLVLALDWTLLVTALHEPGTHGFFDAARVVATVGPAEAAEHPAWYLLISGVCMLLTIAFTAMFTAGLVNRSLSMRSIAVIGRRTMPRADHVIVAGLGQVGLRLCMRLQELHIPVIAVERDPDAPNLRLAKAAGIPVLIAHAEDRSVLKLLLLRRARAFAAMGSDENDNVELAIAALAVAPATRVVMRAGEDDVIAETRSLFHIGSVCDVAALTSHAVALSITGATGALVYMRGPSTDAHIPLDR
jgi:hypothetical protein